MKKLHSITAYALIAPAMTFGIGSAMAQPTGTGTESNQGQEQRKLTEQAQKDQGMTTSERAKERAQKDRMAAKSGQQGAKTDDTYLSQQPANSFRSDELIGQELRSKSGNENVGSISDLLIDEDGQIVAVILEVGGFLGMGTKDVAIAWDSVEHSMNEDRDGRRFTADTTKDALNNAPEYKADRSSLERENQREDKREEQQTTRAGATQESERSSHARAQQDQRGAEDSQHLRAATAEGAAHSGQRQSEARNQGSSESRTTAAVAERETEREITQRDANKSAKQGKTGEQLSKAPANAFHTDSLIGQDVRSQAGDENAGTINDLVIDENGQVVAVVVGLGGVLGIGQRNVAIAWDELQRSSDSEGETQFTTTMTRDALRDAPDYERDPNRSQDGSERSSETNKPLSSN